MNRRHSSYCGKIFERWRRKKTPNTIYFMLYCLLLFLQEWCDEQVFTFILGGMVHCSSDKAKLKKL